MTLRIVVADDQPVIRDGFAALVDAQPDLEVVGRASDGRELVDLVTATAPELALVDIRMPVMDGIEATRRIADTSATRVLILTTFDLDEYVYAAIRAGASGFLLKDVTADRLVESVRLVADGSMLLGPDVSRRLVADFATRRTSGTRAGLPDLTRREHEVLLQLARGRSNQEIADDLVIGAETVKSHVGEVLRKLGLRDRIQAVVYAYEHGLVLPGE
jgi:DNA-binding NarL/FixJ family response regulator